VRVWRISKREFCAFDGEGGRIANARWHRRGARIIYTAGSLALAALEFFLHLPPDLDLKRLVAVPADIPDSLKTLTIRVSDLPAEWRADRNLEKLRDLGMDWLKTARTAVLSVPSFVIPAEQNYLLNPTHARFSRIHVHPPEPFDFEYRLWK